MRCPTCQMNNEENVNFCQACGRRIPRCPTCGVVLTRRDAFCLNDGTRLPEEILQLIPEETAHIRPLEVEFPEETETLGGGSASPELPKEQPAFCENCGSQILLGQRFCTACMARMRSQARKQQKEKRRIIWIILLIAVLLLALAGGIYAVAQSDLFDWSSSQSSTQQKKDKDVDEDDEDTDDEPDTVPATVATTAVDTHPTETEPVETQPVATDPEKGTLEYWIENCDKMYLTKSDLAGFDAQECVYARNACYAKSGRQFNDTQLQAYFAQFDWYSPTVPAAQFSSDLLNAYQVANINVVLAYERSHGY